RQVRVCVQSADRTGTRPRRSGNAAGAGRRGDRVRAILVAARLSAFGTKQTSRDVCFVPKADSCTAARNDFGQSCHATAFNLTLASKPSSRCAFSVERYPLGSAML